jgi:cyclohexadienyl dehydratase
VRNLEARRFDLAMSGVTMRPERAVAGTFTRPETRARAVVLAPQGTSPHAARATPRRNAGGHLESIARQLFPHAVLVLTADNGRLHDPLPPS